MASKVLLADWSTGQFGLIQAGTVMDDGEPRYDACADSGAPFAPYTDDMATLVAAFRNQARILPQGSSVDLSGVLAAGGKLGGFSAPGGSATKQRMLEMEGRPAAPAQPLQGTLGL